MRRHNPNRTHRRRKSTRTLGGGGHGDERGTRRKVQQSGYCLWHETTGAWPSKGKRLCKRTSVWPLRAIGLATALVGEQPAELAHPQIDERFQRDLVQPSVIPDPLRMGDGVSMKRGSGSHALSACALREEWRERRRCARAVVSWRVGVPGCLVG